jgi:hypothetical protein
MDKLSLPTPPRLFHQCIGIIFTGIFFAVGCGSDDSAGAKGKPAAPSASPSAPTPPPQPMAAASKKPAPPADDESMPAAEAQEAPPDSDQPEEAEKPRPKKSGTKGQITVTVVPLAKIGESFVKQELTKAAEAIGVKAIVTAKQDNENYVFTIRPGGDLAKLAEQIASFGNVSNVDEQERKIELIPDLTKVPQEPEKIAANPDHPGYLKQNLDFLKGTNSEQRQAALDRLLKWDVNKDTPQDLRSAVASAMWSRAKEPRESADIRVKATEGMIVWAGKDRMSVVAALLLELLDDKEPRVRQTAMRGLEDNKTDLGDSKEKAIERVAKIFFTQTEDRKAADGFLRSFGSEAEDAVIKQAKGSTANPETMKAAVALLGEIGTKKSIQVLQGWMVAMMRNKKGGAGSGTSLQQEMNSAIQAIKARSKK